jgi:hypothetical protein
MYRQTELDALNFADKKLFYRWKMPLNVVKLYDLGRTETHIALVNTLKQMEGICRSYARNVHIFTDANYIFHIKTPIPE